MLRQWILVPALIFGNGLLYVHRSKVNGSRNGQHARELHTATGMYKHRSMGDTRRSVGTRRDRYHGDDFCFEEVNEGCHEKRCGRCDATMCWMVSELLGCGRGGAHLSNEINTAVLKFLLFSSKIALPTKAINP